jgi:hypothetical protein
VTARRRENFALGLWVCASLGCSYDYVRLRNPDAAADRPVAVDTGPRPMDVLTDTGSVTDVSDAGVTPDRPDVVTRDASRGACTVSYTDIATANRFGTGFVVRASTDTGATNMIVPPGRSGGCMEPTYDPAPERVYRYTVVRGPRLIATLNGSPCETSFDSMLYAVPSCDMAGRMAAFGCSDDDGETHCASCTNDAGTGSQCPHSGLLSTVELTNLVPGDVVYLVVDGYAATMAPRRSSGPFRLSLAENALPLVPPPPAGMDAVANRCDCTALPRAASPVTVNFPGGFPDDMPRDGTPVTLDMNNRSIRGLRPMNLASVTGVSASFRVREQRVQFNSNCVNAMTTPRMTLDLLVAGVVVSSFVVTVGLDAPVQVSTLYHSFQPVPITDRTMVPLELKVREVTPQADCMALVIDPNPVGGSTNTVTLEGAP